MEIYSILGMVFGIIGMTFGIIAFSKLVNLERRLKETGILDDNYKD